MRTIRARFEPALPLAALALLGLGVLTVASTEASPRAALDAAGGAGLRQISLGGLGLASMVVAALLDYRLLRRFAQPVYLGTVALLVAVLVVGLATHGSRRWLELGPVSFQPSEVAKLGLVTALAALLADRLPRGAVLALSTALAGLVTALVLVEPDTGTSLVLAMTWLTLTVAAGARWRTIGMLLALGCGVLPLLFAIAVPAYQRERLAVFLDPARDPLGSGFNLRQAEIAIGSGGLRGHGVFDAWGGTESALAHVAARASDFVFAQLAEDLGLAGTVAVVALFGLIAWRGYTVARTASDEFGRLLAAGLTSVLVGQAALHVAVNLRLFPATGITLPFVSAGGTSLIVACTAIGLIESVALRRAPSRGWGGFRD
ncbi:MAG: FtsW/RodA/SpoVE family cell cycle protein [Dehalococcoidia bacterium]|nr:FtsW/RodA/SpoVE family cell cycle protein [Dehalococcoidia bacterium]